MGQSLMSVVKSRRGSVCRNPLSRSLAVLGLASVTITGAAMAGPRNDDWRSNFGASHTQELYVPGAGDTGARSASSTSIGKRDAGIGARTVACPGPSPFALYNTAQTIATGESPAWAFQETSKNDPTKPYGVTGGNIYYRPLVPTTWAQISQLSLDWKAVTPWGGGSPRISIAVDVDGDGVFRPYYAAPPGGDGWFFVFILDGYPKFYGEAAGWQNTGNLIGNNSPSLYDTGQIHVDLDNNGQWDGKTTDNYAHSLAMVGDKQVFALQIVTDGGWFVPRYGIEEQVVWINNYTVNSDVLTAHAPLTPNTDNYSTAAGTGLNVSAPGVLGNDGNPSSVAMYALNGSAASNGTVTLNCDGSFSYSPNPGFIGNDSFTYTLGDGNFTFGTGTVNINVYPVPTAVNDSVAIGRNSPSTLLEVLRNDSSNGGGPLSVTGTSSAAHGTVGVAAGGGGVLYRPTNGYTGSDSFTYTITNGSASSTATVSVNVRNGFTLKGKLTTSGGVAIVGGTVRITGSIVTVQSDATGTYTFDGLTAGSYTVTPSKAGLAFTPTTRTVNLTGNVNNVNFIGGP